MFNKIYKKLLKVRDKSDFDISDSDVELFLKLELNEFYRDSGIIEFSPFKNENNIISPPEWYKSPYNEEKPKIEFNLEDIDDMNETLSEPLWVITLRKKLVKLVHKNFNKFLLKNNNDKNRKEFLREFEMGMKEEEIYSKHLEMNKKTFIKFNEFISS